MLKGNRGEWSELYVLVKLLAEGKLFQSDFDLNKDLNNVYDVIKAFKDETDYQLEFDRDQTIKLYKAQGETKEYINKFSLKNFEDTSELLFNGIKSGKGRSFSIVEADDFIRNSQVQKLRAGSGDKADVKLRIYDHRLAKETDLGFSIKSLIGGNSTLFNTGPGNNFIYTINDNLKESVSDFNRRTYKPPGGVSKITYRLQELEAKGFSIEFKGIQSSQLWRNLKMIDGDLPEILGWALYYRWVEREPKFSVLSEILEDKDPLNFYNGKQTDQKMYEYKLKRFLAEAAMGMTSEKQWLGEYDSFGGVIIAKNDGDVVCFHIYDFNLFRNYLIQNTKFEQPSTGEDSNNPGNPRDKGKNYFYGWLYEQNQERNFKINLQVRFIK